MIRKNFKEPRNAIGRGGDLNSEVPVVKLDESTAPGANDAQSVFLVVGDNSDEREFAG